MAALHRRAQSIPKMPFGQNCYLTEEAGVSVPGRQNEDWCWMLQEVFSFLVIYMSEAGSVQGRSELSVAGSM